MSPASKVCDQCGRLNSADETACTRCGKRFPGKLELGFARLSGAALGKDAPMVRFYLILCVIVFLLTAWGGGQFRLLASPLSSQSLRWGALHPILVWHEPWRLLSAVFVHFGAFHLLMNMSALVSLGSGLERNFGSTRFVITFVGTGVIGFAISSAWALYGPGSLAQTAGASGGLFGLVGFEVGYLYRSGDSRWKQALMRVVIAAVIIGLLMSANNAAHAGGGVAGAVLGYLSVNQQSWRRFAGVWRALAAVLVAASVVSIALSYTSQTWRIVREAEIQGGVID